MVSGVDCALNRYEQLITEYRIRNRSGRFLFGTVIYIGADIPRQYYGTGFDDNGLRHINFIVVIGCLNVQKDTNFTDSKCFQNAAYDFHIACAA